MDERKRTINDLELKKMEARRSLDLLYEDFGGKLFGRFPGQETLLGETAEDYLRFQKELTDSQSLVQLAEADVRRLSELEEDIHAKERENALVSAEFPNACVDVGRDALGEERFSTLLETYRQQVEGLIPKLEEVKGKLEELDDRAGSGFFGWIGKNTQGAVYRTLAARHQGSLKKLYAAAGEKLAAPEHESLVSGHDLEDAVRILRDMKAEIVARNRDLAALREEQHRLKAGPGPEGGPFRRIQKLEKHIAFIRSELKAVYRRLGAEAVAGGQEGQFDRFFQPEDQRIIEMGRQSGEAIAGYDRSIEKLKTSIAIDEKKAEIERMKRAVVEQEQRIAGAEERIRNIKAQIEETEARIKELSKLL
ncbi:MAG: hypothetical protein LBD96_11690 [Treponema sp.]|jgi:chromosome segregation ATPase|nr:hypothetical protein [Treponema sp.]